MTLSRRSFLLTGSLAPLAVSLRDCSSNQSASPKLICEVSGLSGLVRYNDDKRMDMLFVDPYVNYGHLMKHETVMVSRFDDVDWTETTLKPSQQFVDATGYMVLWKMNGFDVSLEDARSETPIEYGGSKTSAISRQPAPLNKICPYNHAEWDDLIWVPHMHLLAPGSGGRVRGDFIADEIHGGGLITARLRLTEGSVKTLKPRDADFAESAWKVFGSTIFRQVVADATAHSVPLRSGRTLLATPQKSMNREAGKIVFYGGEVDRRFWITSLPPDPRVSSQMTAAMRDDHDDTPTLDHIYGLYDLLQDPPELEKRRVPYREGKCLSGGTASQVKLEWVGFRLPVVEPHSSRSGASAQVKDAPGK